MTTHAIPSLTRKPIRRHETQVALAGQQDRYQRSWLPENATRSMVLVHGFAEHAGRYDEMAMYFAERGFAVHAYDQAGHGRTSGPRGHVDEFERLIDDLRLFVDEIAEAHPDRPIVLVGHSMGGLVAAGAAAFRSLPVERVVLSGALLMLGGPAAGLRQRFRLGLAKVLSIFAPRLAFETGLDPEGISRDPEVVRRYREDPFVKDRMSARFAAGMNRWVHSVLLAAPHFAHPVLVLHGESDPIVTPLGSQRFFESLSPSVVQQSQLNIYPGHRHEIFQEPERESIWQEILTWIDAQSSSMGDEATR